MGGGEGVIYVSKTFVKNTFIIFVVRIIFYSPINKTSLYNVIQLRKVNHHGLFHRYNFHDSTKHDYPCFNQVAFK
jgi:hypothetical protein